MQKLFLLAVEEMNFTKAAKRGFVTQQCLSKNIKQFEKELNVELFKRSPKLTLTPAGRMVFETLRKVEILEHDLKSRLEQVQQESLGSLTLGINSSRGRVLLPEIYERFQSRYPHVEVSVVLDDNVSLEKRLLNNELDLFLGVNYEADPVLHSETVSRDQVFLLATEKFLQQHLPGSTDRRPPVSGDFLDLAAFPSLPLTGNREGSSFAALCHHFLLQQGIVFTQQFSVSDYETQISLCGRSLAAAFCPQTILSQVAAYNRGRAEEQRLLVFRIAGWERTVNLSIVWPELSSRPHYLTDFMDIMRQVIYENELYTAEMLR